MPNGLAATSFLGSLYRVFHAGERLLVEEAELMRLDSQERIVSAAAKVGFMALGGLFLWTAWLGVLITWVVAFDGVLTLAGRLGLAILAQVVLGSGFLIAARRERSSRDAASGA
jgi:hypothetical protein